MACLGSSFTANTILLVCTKQVFDISIEISNYGKIKEKMMVRLDGGHSVTYRCVHDKVQEAALSLIPPEKIGAFCFDIGIAWYSELGQTLGCTNFFCFLGPDLYNPARRHF